MSKAWDFVYGKRVSIAGFALCLVWVFVASHDLSISVSISFIHDLSARTLLVTGTFVGFATTCLLLRRGPQNMTPLCCIAAVSMAIGFLLYAFPSEMAVPEAISLCCMFIAGAGYGFLFLAWLLLLGNNGTRTALALFGCAILLASAMDIVALLVPRYVLLSAMPLLPVASAALYLHERNGVPGRNARSLEKPTGKAASEGWHRAAGLLLVPTFVEGFAYGSFLQLMFNTNATLANHIGIAALALAAVALASVSLAYPAIMKSATVFVACAVVALAFSFMPLVLDDVRVFIFVLMFGYNFMYFFAIAVAIEIRAIARYALLTCIAAVVLSFEAGNILGALTLGSFLSVVDANSYCIAISNVVVYTLLVGAFAAAQYLAKMQADEAKNPAPADREGAFCKRHDLSKRESDVFALLVRGRTAAVIAERLFISTETARVHIRSIYRKTGVHSQQELIDLFESEDGEG